MYRLILFRLVENYFRHRKLYLLPIVVLLAFGIAYVTISKPKYMAQGIVYIQKSTYLSQLTNSDSSSSPWWTPPSQDVINQINELVQTDAFIRALIQETSLESEMAKGPQAVSDTISSVRKSIWAIRQGDNQILIGASYENPEVAVQLVNAVINSYIRWGTNGKRNDSVVALNFFTDLITQYKNELEQSSEAMRVYLEAHPNPLRGDRPALEQMEITRLQTDINQAQTRYSNALDKEEDARLSIVQVESDSQQTYMVIDAPHIPDSGLPSRREMAKKLAIFVGVGVMLSAIAIVGSAMFDRRFHVPIDVQQLSLPLLAVVPDINVIQRQQRKQPKARPEKSKKFLLKGKQVQKDEPAMGPVQLAVTSLPANTDPTEPKNQAEAA